MKQSAIITVVASIITATFSAAAYGSDCRISGLQKDLNEKAGFGMQGNDSTPGAKNKYYFIISTHQWKKMSSDDEAQPHVLIFPAPLQGHVPPTLNLAELLASDPGLHMTFLNTEHIHSLVSRAPHVLEPYSKLPNFRFLTIPDGLPVDHPRSSLGFLDSLDSIKSSGKEEYKKMLGKVDGWPWVTCVLADGLFQFAYEVAVETGVPTMIMCTSSACSVLAYYSAQALILNGEVPF